MSLLSENPINDELIMMIGKNVKNEKMKSNKKYGVPDTISTSIFYFSIIYVFHFLLLSFMVLSSMKKDPSE